MVQSVLVVCKVIQRRPMKHLEHNNDSDWLKPSEVFLLLVLYWT